MKPQTHLWLILMHKNTINWYLQVTITPDAALAEKRWTTATAVTKKLSRYYIIELLKLFLFPPSNSIFTEKFTTELIELDNEFPLRDNIQDLRLMAGLIMVNEFEERSYNADAFALGLAAASFPLDRVQVPEPGIIEEAKKYLDKESNMLRSDNFANMEIDITKKLNLREKALAEAIAANDDAKRTATLTGFSESVVKTIAESHRLLVGRVQQLAEECGLLWWVLTEYSDTLKRPVGELSQQSYALTAASEAAKRTILLPPPPCIGPLLMRGLKPCKPGKKNSKLSDFIIATEPALRSIFMESVRLEDCYGLVPLCAVIKKTEELGSMSLALEALPNLCPGVSGDLPLTAAGAAQQFYSELVFLRALDLTSGD